jgi:hypothetical protein
MRDETRQEVRWGKMFPQLMLCAARYRAELEPGKIAPNDVTFSDGEVLGSDDPRAHGKLSAQRGPAATLRPLQPASDRNLYLRHKPDRAQWAREIGEAFVRKRGELALDFSQFPPVPVDYVSVPGTFFNNEALNLATAATLTSMAARNPEARWDVRRCRPNFLIDTGIVPAALAE